MRKNKNKSWKIDLNDHEHSPQHLIAFSNTNMIHSIFGLFDYHSMNNASPPPMKSILQRSFKDGTKFTYNVISRIGNGGFGIVYSAIEKPTNRRVALKCTPKKKLEDPKIKKKLISEIDIHRSLHHKNIVKFDGFFHDKDYVYFVLELCDGGNVLEYLKKKETLSEFETANIIRQIVDSLVYLHSNGIIHRDIKLQNFLMMKNGTVKLSDFGLSVRVKSLDDSTKPSVCGTPGYLSPEVVTRGHHTFAIDIWAMGVSVYTMLTGKQPFKSADRKQVFQKIRQVSYTWPNNMMISENAKSFVNSVLKRDPLERPSAQNLAHHPFLDQIQRKTLRSGRMFPKSLSCDIVHAIEIAENQTTNTTATSSTNTFSLKKNLSGPFPENAVQMWWDYSSKYGLAYILFNGYVGACFNDSSRMILDPSDKFIQYYLSPHSPMEVIMLDDEENTNRLRKKIILMKQTYLD